MNLVDMTPRPDLCSTGYCLANPVLENAEYLVYLPSGNTTVDLSNTPVEMAVEWFNPENGSIMACTTVNGGGTHSFSAPFSGDAVLYLQEAKNVATLFDISIGGTRQGCYPLASSESKTQTFPGENGGPVVVASNNGVNIIASYLQFRRPGSTGGWTGITQTLGFTDAQVSDKYVFPYYDFSTPLTRYNSLQLANFDTIATNISVEIGGVLKGTYPIDVGSSQNVTFPGVAGGPVVVYSDNGAKIVVSLYELKRSDPKELYTGQTQMMGLPWSQLTDTYVIPRYNYTLTDLWPFVAFANASDQQVTVTIGGVLQGTYNLDVGESQVENYPGVNGGPVVVKSNNGANIIASYLQFRRPGRTGGWTGITQTMGFTDAQVSDKYVFPRYDFSTPLTRYNSLQLANFDTIPTNVIVEIGGVQQGSFSLDVGSSQNVTFDGVVGGPVVVYSDNGAKIVVSLYELKRSDPKELYTGQTQMMGLPWSQLTDTYIIPRYNYTLTDLWPFVVFGVP